MPMRTRGGFTLVELIVVLLVIGLLAGLLIPSGCQLPGRSRQTTCTNNLGNLARAALIRTASARGDFPGYLQPFKFGPAASTSDRIPATPAPDAVIAWSGMLLPQLDQHALWGELIQATADFDRPPRMEVFLCPSDALLNAEYPGLSYVANTGTPDVTPAKRGDASDVKANGVFHNLLPDAGGPKVFYGRDTPDGASRTLLLAENFQRDDPSSGSQPGHTYLGPALVPAEPGAANIEQWYGMMWVVDPQNPMNPRASRMERFGADTRTGPEVDRPHSQYQTRFARPASNHPDLFIVAFCDGSTRAISNDIDYRVYQQLLTPNGSKCEWLADPTVDLSAVAPPFRNLGQPLKEADYSF